MKHVFYTHSAITTRLCLGVIESEQIAKSDVVWLTARNECVADAMHVYRVEDFEYKLPCKGINFLGCRMALRKWRRAFGQMTDGHLFTSYLPQTNQLIFQLIATHPQCAGYHLIEEGMAAYFRAGARIGPHDEGNSKLIRLFKKLYHYANYGGSYRKNRPIQDCFNDRYSGCYTWNKFGFPSYENKKVLKCPFVESKDYAQIEALVVLDAVVEAGLVEKEWMVEALLLLFRDLQNRGISRLGVKLHPETMRLGGNIPMWWEMALSGMEASFSITWIPRDFVVEELAMRKGLLLLVNLSSVGLYAVLMGREVVSIARLIAEHSTSYAHLVDQMPDVWSDNVNYLRV